MAVSAYRQGDQIVLADPDDVRELREVLRAFREAKHERPRVAWSAADRVAVATCSDVLGLPFSRGLTLSIDVWAASCKILGPRRFTLASPPAPAWRPARRVRDEAPTDDAEEGIRARSRL
jgi:hypothetical protein